MADDLSTPLGQEAPRRPRRRRRPDAVTALAIVVLVLGGGIALWLLAVRHPLGGEPSASVAIHQTLPRPAQAAKGETVDGDTATPATAAAAAPPDGPLIIKVPHAGAAAGHPGQDPAAPQPALLEDSKYGPLPRIAADGRRPADVYARPAPTVAAGTPEVAVLVGGLGIGSDATEAAIGKLPPEISLGFAPYGSDLARWTDAARRHGHETILQVPMEPFDFPSNDPGPQTLLTSLPTAANLERLRWSLGRIAGYVGVSNYMGAKFTADEDALRPVLNAAGHRGLLFIDDGASPRSLVTRLGPKLGLTAARADVTIDAVPAPGDIAAALATLEAKARSNGHAIGVAGATPLVLTAIAAWARHLEQHGIALVPVSAVAGKPARPPT